jgi:membrane protein implicated in regulation of membrane protease activity
MQMENMMLLSPSLIWFLAGVGFLVAELLVPGFILIFFTAGCWIAAIALIVIDISVATQILLFLSSSLVLLFTLRKYSLKIFKGKISDDIDDHYSDAIIGKTAIVTKSIMRGRPGEIKAMGSFWRAIADNSIEKGNTVVIESQESEGRLTFKVKPL